MTRVGGFCAGVFYTHCGVNGGGGGEHHSVPGGVLIFFSMLN